LAEKITIEQLKNWLEDGQRGLPYLFMAMFTRIDELEKRLDDLCTKTKPITENQIFFSTASKYIAWLVGFLMVLSYLAKWIPALSVFKP